MIHPTAVVDPHAELAEDVQVDAYAVIGGSVTIGAGTHIGSHSVIHGPTAIGSNCRIGPGAYVGLDGQHLEFLSRPLAERQKCWLLVGDNVILRETSSVHRATRPGRENATRIGNDCMLMGGAHVAHDCVLENSVVMANSSLLGGHAHIGERAFIGGASAVHQFARIGRIAMLGGNEGAGHDVPPFAALFQGGLKGYNAIGCRRAGIGREGIKAIRAAYYCIHTHRTRTGALRAIEDAGLADAPEVRELLTFIQTSKRGIQPSVKFLNYFRIRPEDEQED